MHSELFEKLKRFAAIHPDKIETLTKKELDNIELNESEVHNNGYVYEHNIFVNPNFSMHI